MPRHIGRLPSPPTAATQRIQRSRSATRTSDDSASRSPATWPTPSSTGNSAKAWYLLAEPVDLPVIEMAFLNGQESPTIETAEADFNQLGIKMRGYHDFGVALQYPRGGLKAKGEA